MNKGRGIGSEIREALGAQIMGHVAPGRNSGFVLCRMGRHWKIESSGGHNRIYAFSRMVLAAEWSINWKRHE